MARKKTKSSHGPDKNNQKPAITKQKKKTRQALAKQFIETVVFSQYRQLVSWRTVTGQSSQLDSGYLAQQLMSILTGVPGSGTRGKGVDLEDGSEVKAASTLSGKDVPRWNNKLKSEDKIEEYLKNPNIYFVLFDTIEKRESFPLRVRIWRVKPAQDAEFKRVVRDWANNATSDNFQLHPPCWRSDNVSTNNAGNLELPLMFYAEQIEIGDIDYMEIRQFKIQLGKCKRVCNPEVESE